MTFEEQIRVIELKGLSAEDERQVFTKLVCISIQNKIDDAAGSYDSFKDTKNIPEQMWYQLLNVNAQQRPLKNMSFIRSTMERCLEFPYKDEKARKASSVPNIPTSPHLLPATDLHL